AVFLDPFHVALDKVVHIAEGALHVGLFRDFLSAFEDGLDSFGATAGAGPMNAVSTPPVVRAQFPTGDIEQRLGQRPPERGLEDVERRGDSEWRVLPLQEVND